MPTRDELINKGRAEKRRSVLDQADVQIALAKKYATELEKVFWTAANTENLEKKRDDLQNYIGEREENRNASQYTRVDETKSVQSAKEFIRKMRIAVSVVEKRSSDRKSLPINSEDLQAGESLGRNTSKIRGYLVKIQDKLAKLDDQLKPYFAGEKVSEACAGHIKALQESNAAQEISVADLPKDTAEMYFRTGDLLNEIETLNRLGQLAFDGDSLTRAQFNKDMILRARAKQAKEGTDEGGSDSVDPVDSAPSA